MSLEGRAVTGSVLVLILATAGVYARPDPAPVAARVLHLSGDVARPGWYGADRLGPAVAAAGGVVAVVATPLQDGDHARLVGPYLVGTAPPPAVATEAWTPAKLRLNEASQAELEALPRVGPVLAERIRAARPFRSLADLDRVKGVGPATLAVLRPLVVP